MNFVSQRKARERDEHFNDVFAVPGETKLPATPLHLDILVQRWDTYKHITGRPIIKQTTVSCPPIECTRRRVSTPMNANGKHLVI